MPSWECLVWLQSWGSFHHHPASPNRVRQAEDRDSYPALPLYCKIMTSTGWTFTGLLKGEVPSFSWSYPARFSSEKVNKKDTEYGVFAGCWMARSGQGELWRGFCGTGLRSDLAGEQGRPKKKKTRGLWISGTCPWPRTYKRMRIRKLLHCSEETRPTPPKASHFLLEL